MKTKVVRGVECVVLPVGNYARHSSAVMEVAKDVGKDVVGICSLCPCKTQDHECSAIGTTEDCRALGAYIPTKYWPIVQMRSNHGDR